MIPHNSTLFFTAVTIHTSKSFNYEIVKRRVPNEKLLYKYPTILMLNNEVKYQTLV